VFFAHAWSRDLDHSDFTASPKLGGYSISLYKRSGISVLTQVDPIDPAGFMMKWYQIIYYS